MTDSLKKFQALPLEQRQKLSSALFLDPLEKLEQQYNVKLVSIFIKLIVNDLLLSDLDKYIQQNYNLSVEARNQIKDELSRLLAMANSERSVEQKRFLANSQQNKTKFSFSQEDEAEAEQYQDLARSGNKQDSQSLAKDIVARLKILATDEVRAKRLFNIVLAGLKGVRDDLELKDVLTKSRKIGGMELSPDQADKVIALVKNSHQSRLESFDEGDLSVQTPATKEKKIEFPGRKPFQPAKTNLLEKKQQSQSASLRQPLQPGWQYRRPNNTVYQPPKIVPAGKMLKIEDEAGLPTLRLPEDDELMVKPKLINNNQALRPNKKVLPNKESTNQKTLPSPQPAPHVKNIQSQPIKSPLSSRPNLDGVKFTPKLMGPIEELGSMTLIDFRRLAESPEAAVKKIMEKVELLSKDSLVKKLSGIEAWKKNEVSRFYRLLGQESMKQGKGIEEIINDRLNEGKPTLSIDEFYAIMDLHQVFKY